MVIKDGIVKGRGTDQKGHTYEIDGYTTGKKLKFKL